MSKCKVEEWCPDGVCVEGHTGKDCARCETDFFMFQGNCRECPDKSGLSFFLGCLLAVVLSSAAYGAAKSHGDSHWHGKSMAIISMFLTHFQVIVIYFSFDIVQPSFFINLTDFTFKIFSFDFIELASPECSVGSLTFPIFWALKTGAPLALMAPLVIIALCYTLKEGQAMWNCLGALCCLACFYFTLPLGACVLCVGCLRACCTIHKVKETPEDDLNADPEKGAVVTSQPKKKPEKVVMETKKVKVPPGARPGSTVQMKLPTGQQIEVKIPMNARVGAIIHVKVPKKVGGAAEARQSAVDAKGQGKKGKKGAAKKEKPTHKHDGRFNTRALVAIVMMLNATYIIMMRSAASVLTCTDGVMEGQMDAAPYYTCGETEQVLMVCSAVLFLFCGFVVVNIGIYNLAALNKRVDRAVRYDLRDGALWWGPATNIFKLTAVLAGVLFHDYVPLECTIMIIATSMMAALCITVQPHEVEEGEKLINDNNKLEFLLYTNQTMLVITLLMGHEEIISTFVMGMLLAVLYFLAAVFLVFIIKINYLGFLFKKKKEPEDEAKDDKALLDENLKSVMEDRDTKRSSSIDRSPAPPPRSSTSKKTTYNPHHLTEPGEGEEYDTARVLVPTSARPGDLVVFKLEDGRKTQAKVPEHARPGHHVTIKVPKPAATKLRGPVATDAESTNTDDYDEGGGGDPFAGGGAMAMM